MWRKQRRKQRLNSGPDMRTTVRASPWASKTVKADEFIPDDDLRVQMAKISVQSKAGAAPMGETRRSAPVPEDVFANAALGGANQKAEEKEPPFREKKKKVKRLRPTHFLCVRIGSNAVSRALARAQDAVVDTAPELDPTRIDPATFHITISVLCLNGPHELKMAQAALDASRADMALLLHGEPLELRLRGLGHFGNRVLFAELVHGGGILAEYKKKFEARLREAGAPDSAVHDPDKPLAPHLTLLKLSKQSGPRRKKGQKRLRKIPPTAWAPERKRDFGCTRCETVDLCDMTAPRDPGAFYATPHAINIQFSSVGVSAETPKRYGSRPTEEELRKTLEDALQQPMGPRRRGRRRRNRQVDAPD